LAAKEELIRPHCKVGKNPWSRDGALVWHLGLVVLAEREEKTLTI